MNISIDKVTEEMLKEVMKKRRVPSYKQEALGISLKNSTERNEMEESEQKRQLELLGVIKAELERDISALIQRMRKLCMTRRRMLSISPCTSAEEKDVLGSSNTRWTTH